MQYSEKLMDHFKNPRNQGVIDDADAIGEKGNMKCGDIMKVYLKIHDDMIQDIKFETLGCAAAIATSSMLTDLAKGKTLDEALKIDKQDIVDELGGVPAPKFHCSVLAEAALKDAIEQYRAQK
ncbi:iron-sulfur cluster assembly scaffold protein [Candidatus Falkowbacteria bacterium CG10_big_fil_rev_8_21_14_0_10_39_11]|uniref:Iron-sulfur cluster assembly scaffold protein n=1 Tax=Candidatus Falkowbacteria bacterium CG10_big_fil_rev_8_21_14_0_10_39_11 TaxID=1974565 RepID=A0A2H0V3C9_9BACT|nr:MAG: iron-sulfur cluster assembly scaffold protein [Candidatus Falkowbacteria bacterium CG10_big_fil_rev_8_21_14_0_10_39_11]